MKKQIKSMLGITLAIALLLSFMPIATFAKAQQGILVQNQEADTQSQEASPTSEDAISDQNNGSDAVPDGQSAKQGLASPTAPTEPGEAKAPESEPDKLVETPKAPAKMNTLVKPELTKVVDKPLVEVVYHYYDKEQSQNISDFSDYSVTSTHSYYAIAMADGSNITIEANKFPDRVPVNTDALRFRVLLNGSEDITALSTYNATTGLVSLPYEYMGHEITVVWYCPATEIRSLPVTVTICIGSNGKFTTTTKNLLLLSDTNQITIPMDVTNGLVVSQNGLDLLGKSFSIKNGSLAISAPALGGDMSVSAYALSVKPMGIGIKPLGTDITQVVHTRSGEQIYYGYYTSYYTANGNTAFCLDPNASGLAAGTYSISRFLQRGSDDTLIKCAYYLYGGPGWASHKNIMFQSPDTMTAYGLCHAAASYVYLNDPSAFQGISSTTRDQLMNLIAYVNALPMPPNGFDAFVYNESSSTTQSLMGWDYSEPTEPPEPPAPPADGHLEIIKTSSNPAMTDSNNCYSLAGAVFDVYNSYNQKIGSITTDASGRGRLQNIPPESGYYIIETKPPQGYALNSSSIGFSILSDQTTTLTVSNRPQNDPPAIMLNKLDAETSAATPQGGASLAGAEFTIKYYKGLYSASQLSGLTPARTWVLRTDANGMAFLNASYLVSGDPFYYSGNNDPTLPLGTVTVQETKAPTGYLINSELYIRQITSTGTAETVRVYNEPVVKESVIRGGISIEKWDFELDRRADPQGDATLAGSVLEIYNRNTNSVVVGGKTYAAGALVHTMTTDATGTASTANDLLPYGQYEIVEKIPPTGYLNTGVIRQMFNVTTNNVIVNLKTSVTAIKNNPIRGGVEIVKWDIERDELKLKQGDATLEGAVFEIRNRSPKSVLVDGVEYAPNAVVYTLTTNTDGWAGTTNDLLPYGSYEIMEVTPPVGYLNTGTIKQSFQIREHGVVVDMTASDKVIKNNIIRGGVMVEKWDNEINEHRPQGGATFEGAIFEIVNLSADAVLVQDNLYDIGDVVYTFSTDATGAALTPDDLLPYGTYLVREIAPPDGYLATGVLSQIFMIREHGKIVDLNASDTAIKNNPIRGDFKGVKIADGDAGRLAGVPFKITSKTTGESHVIITDKNGMFDTSSAWNPHSQNTNRGTSDKDGIWFGEIDVLDDALGALLYDDYIIEELPCAANADKKLLTFEVSIYRHMTVVDLGTLTNDYVPQPEIFTTAMDKETTQNVAFLTEITTILDTVYYSGLKAGKEYTIKGVLMDKATNKPLPIDGKEVTASTTFRATGESGSVPMEFKLNSLSLKGKSVVVFETLLLDDKEIAVHADIEDAGQTVVFLEPKIGTNAKGSGGSKDLDVSSQVTIVDVVSYEGLIIGKTYTVKGTLMDKATSKPLLVDGKTVTAEKTFIAETASGKVEVTFTVNALTLKGKSVVVFESLEYNSREIAAHADINDQNQTVKFKEPRIGTTATGVNGEKALPVAAQTSIVDTVSYDDLTPGKTYTLKGVIMDKSTGKPLLVNSAEVRSEVVFTPDKASGQVKVTFTVNSLALKDKEVVVFERLYCENVEIAIHEDITDAGQTVKFKGISIRTTATSEDSQKIIPVAEKAKIIDVVAYESLIVGEQYTLKGSLMDKKTGKPLLVNGKEVTAETSFTAKTVSGSVQMTFVLDTMELEGKIIVVFESLEHQGKEIASHKDLDDAAQTVEVRKRTTPKTGDENNLVLWFILLSIGLAGSGLTIYLFMKRSKMVTDIEDMDID